MLTASSLPTPSPLQVDGRGGGRVVPSHRVYPHPIRPAASRERKREILESWYREQLKAVLPPLIAKWEPLIGVHVERCFVQKMRTKWGSCNHESRNIRLNTDLAKKPPECLEYIVVHELAHLLEPTHNLRFIALMDQFMPKWRFYKDRLNRLPVRHEDWAY
ncbi:MAG: SprT family zinc-dependent metalloprotease [Gallionella sp.]